MTTRDEARQAVYEILTNAYEAEDFDVEGILTDFFATFGHYDVEAVAFDDARFWEIFTTHDRINYQDVHIPTTLHQAVATIDAHRFTVADLWALAEQHNVRPAIIAALLEQRDARPRDEQ